MLFFISLQLDMPTEHLTENFVAYIQALSRYRTSGILIYQSKLWSLEW